MLFTADSGVWINGRVSAATDTLDAALNDERTELVMLDVVLMEVLRGFRSARALRQAEQTLAVLPVAWVGGQRTARAAAYLYRALHQRGITVRSAIDLVDRRLVHRTQGAVAARRPRFRWHGPAPRPAVTPSRALMG